ncbi:MAG: 4Fe-4S binding protein [Actinobacteria bacterium]|nr:4Fe-4S binding protein [Actinomycetota bacterium]
MRQKTRRVIIFIALFLFPLTLNYFSPYVSVDGAFKGIVSGSLIFFLLLFISGIFFSRAWCGWLCPIAGISELGMTINDKPVPVRKLKMVRYSIFAVWFSLLLAGFVLAGGIKGIDPLHLTENVISVDEPLKFITYYLVLFIFFGLTILIGRRGACHSICWMSPFLLGGYTLGRLLHIPQLRIKTNPSNCIECKKCTKVCSMSIDVEGAVKSGEIASTDCVLCGECVDTCPKNVLEYGFRR